MWPEGEHDEDFWLRLKRYNKMNDYGRFIDILGEELEAQLATKTGWGRNEVRQAYDKACVKALIRLAKEQGVVLE